ncbi:hypothetical protein Hanom_Chr11g00978661 [Helianthus anomalus]
MCKVVVTNQLWPEIETNTLVMHLLSMPSMNELDQLWPEIKTFMLMMHTQHSFRNTWMISRCIKSALARNDASEAHSSKAILVL